MRVFLALFAVLLFVFGCDQQIEKTLLQEDEIALAQPRVRASSSLIDTSVTISADLRLDGVNIYYTDDGTVPTMESTKYTQVFESSQEGIYTFKAFHSSWKPSETAILELYKKGKTPSNIVWFAPASIKYNGKGESTVINQEKASLNFKDSRWVGFDSIAVAEVTFEKKTFIKSINIGYLSDVQSWIFPPANVRISSVGMKTIEIEIPGLTEPESKRMKNLEVVIGKELSSVRIEVQNLSNIPDWHDGKENKAWLFMDEWIFN